MRTVIATENKDNWKQLQLLLDKGIKRWFNDRYSLNQVEFTYDKNNQAELNIQQEVDIKTDDNISKWETFANNKQNRPIVDFSGWPEIKMLSNESV